jgi:hypothetical protein
VGAGLGIALAEWLLLVLAAWACSRAGARVPLARPLASALAASLPMTLAVWSVRDRLELALPLAGAVQLAVTAAAAWHVRRGERERDLRYP